MSDNLEMGTPNSPIRRRGQNPQPPSQGLTAQLPTPGLAQLPPDSQGVTLTDQLLRAMGAAGNVAGEYNQEEYYARREARANAEEARSAQRGQGSLASETDLPLMEQKLVNGDINVPDGMTADQFARQVATPRVEGLPDDTKTAYMQHFVPRFTAAVVAHQQKLKAENNDQLAQWFTADAVADPSRIITSVQAMMKADPTIDDTNAWAKVGLPVARTLAARGDGPGLDTVLTAMGDRHPVEVEAIKQRYASVDTAITAQAKEDLNNKVARMVLSGNASSEIRQAIQDERKVNPRIDENDVAKLMHEQDVRDNQAMEGFKAAALRLEIQKATATKLSKDLGLIGSGNMANIEEEEVPLSNGTSHHFARDESARNAFNTFVANFARTPGATPQQVEDFKLRTAVTNGYVPPEYLRELKAGEQAAALWTVDKAGPMPPTVARGYQRYQELQAKAPNMLRSEGVADTVKFYEKIDLARLDPMNQDPAQAAMAALLTHNSKLLPVPYKAQDLADAADEAAPRARNAPWVASAIKQRAEEFQRNGVPPEDALSQASEKVKADLVRVVGHPGFFHDDHWYLPANDANLPQRVREQLGPTLADIRQRYWERNGEALSMQGLKAKNIGWAPGPSGTFQLINETTGAPMPRLGSNMVIWTSADVTRFYDTRAKEVQAAQDAATIERNRARNDIKMPHVLDGMPLQ